MKNASTAEALQAAEKIVSLNEALLIGALRQHELTEDAETLNAQLKVEITARHKAARELEEKARLLDLSNDAIVVRGWDGRIASWNKGAERLFGWPREEAMGKDLHALLHSKLPKPEEEILEELHRSGQFSGEVEQISREGKVVHSCCRWVWDADTRSILTSFTDATERKTAEDALRESEGRYRSLFASAPMAVFVCDHDAVIQDYNRRAVELWGREPVRGVEQHCGSLGLWLPDGTPLLHWNSPMREVLRTGIPANDVRVLIERGDGSRLPVIVNYAALRDGQGLIIGGIASFMDITDWLLVEAAMAEHAADLVRADRSKNEFLAMLAHELRNPLAPLRISAELLWNTSAGPEVRAQAHSILGRQIDNMSRMIDDLLDVSRITEGKIELRRQEVDLESVMSAAAAHVRPGMEQNRQTLTIVLPEEPVHLEADVTRLDQILGNLLTNACKYGNEGGNITVTAARTPLTSPDDPPEVIITVADDGIGIAPVLLPRIFDLFVQATHTLERAHGGLGIGLTLVQRLVKLHGGTIEARSEGLGLGSEFIVRLPILRETLPPAPAAPLPTSTPAARRILVVDDNVDAAESMAMLQGLQGHSARAAHSGPEAIAAAAEFLPDVVLLDIGLPGMDGYEVARQLRANPLHAGIFLVAITGYGRETDRALSKSAGFDQHLVKPADLQLLSEWLGGL